MRIVLEPTLLTIIDDDGEEHRSTHTTGSYGRLLSAIWEAETLEERTWIRTDTANQRVRDVFHYSLKDAAERMHSRRAAA